MMITQSHVDAALLRYDDELAAAARSRTIAAATQRPTAHTSTVAAATQSDPATRPQSVHRLRASLRQAIVSLMALGSIGRARVESPGSTRSA